MSQGDNSSVLKGHLGNVTAPYFGRFCHRVIVTISDKHCNSKLPATTKKREANMPFFINQHFFAVSTLSVVAWGLELVTKLKLRHYDQSPRLRVGWGRCFCFSLFEASVKLWQKVKSSLRCYLMMTASAVWLCNLTMTARCRMSKQPVAFFPILQ